MSLVTASIASTSPFSGAQSLRISVPNCSPSRTLMTATPCTPMSPLTITWSPDAGPVRTDVHAVGHDADAGRVHVDAVAVAGLDDLGVPGDDAYAGPLRGLAETLAPPRRPG